MARQFRAPKSQDFEIVDDGSVVGAIRVKPNAILWSPKGLHSWYTVKLDDFGKFAEANGRKSKK